MSIVILSFIFTAVLEFMERGVGGHVQGGPRQSNQFMSEKICNVLKVKIQ